MIQELAVRYEDKMSIDISGKPRYVYLNVTGRSMERARQVLSIIKTNHDDAIIVKREVTEWEKVE